LHPAPIPVKTILSAWKRGKTNGLAARIFRNADFLRRGQFFCCRLCVVVLRRRSPIGWLRMKTLSHGFPAWLANLDRTWQNRATDFPSIPAGPAAWFEK